MERKMKFVFGIMIAFAVTACGDKGEETCVIGYESFEDGTFECSDGTACEDDADCEANCPCVEE